MGMPQIASHWTAEMVRALPDDGNRYEVVDGELLVTPSPLWIHQRAAQQLAWRFDAHVRRLGIGEALMSPADIELDPASMVQPDVFVYGKIEGRRPRKWNEGAPLLLVLEVLSPGTARVDRNKKRRRYQRAGIPEYWIVDFESRIIERWRPPDERPEILADTIEWLPPGGIEPLTIDLGEYFRLVHDEQDLRT